MGDGAERAKLGWVLIAALLFAGCGGGGNAGPGGTGTGGTYAAKCEAGCRPSSTSGPCTGQDPTQCTHDCTVLTEGLTVDCATCIAQHISWEFGSTCYGPSIPKTTGSECAALCSPMNPG